MGFTDFLVKVAKGGLRVGSLYKKGARSTLGAVKPAGGANYPGGFMEEMTQREAMLILGYKESKITEKELKKRHTKIMISNHPDRGGSIYLANKVNEARDLLKDYATKE